MGESRPESAGLRISRADGASSRQDLKASIPARAHAQGELSLPLSVCSALAPSSLDDARYLAESSHSDAHFFQNCKVQFDQKSGHLAAQPS